VDARSNVRRRRRSACLKVLARRSIDAVVAANQPSSDLGLRRASRSGHPPAWIPQPGQHSSFEIDALWDRFGDRLATCALIGHYEERVEFHEGTPLEHAISKIDEFFRWYADEAQVDDFDSPAAPFTRDDYERLDQSVLEELARRAFEHLHRAATA
jgi:hypothetical protein